MSYFGFLALFLGPPIVILAVSLAKTFDFSEKSNVSPPRWNPYAMLLAHIVVAVLWTTPWDNYLVATRVWWYDPALVTGLTIWYVPIEEYTFFVVQPIMTGLFLLWLMRRVQPPVFRPKPAIRAWGTAILGVIWLIFAFTLLVGAKRFTYLSLELTWALPPIMLQVGFGGDILWQNRRLIALALFPTTLYLCIADAIAIGSGTWTISPTQSLDWLIFGRLPLEEFLFFLLTNILIIFGMVLVLSEVSQERFNELTQKRRNTENLFPYFLAGFWLLIMICVPILGWIGGESARNLGIQAGVIAQAVVVIAFSVVAHPPNLTSLRDLLGFSHAPHPILLIILTTTIFTFAIEAIGTTTGFPFGEYRYTKLMQPQLAHVPLLIPLAWLMMLPPSWAVAYRWRDHKIMFAVVSATAMTAWDLLLDPQMVAWGFWEWAKDGAYFGIPLSNFGGWWLTAFVLSTLLYKPATQIITNRVPFLTIYATTWFLETFGLALFWGLGAPALIGGLIMGGMMVLGWSDLVMSRRLEVQSV